MPVVHLLGDLVLSILSTLMRVAKKPVEAEITIRGFVLAKESGPSDWEERAR